MDIICLQDDAFYALIEEVVNTIKENRVKEDKWISPKAETTLQKLRDEGRSKVLQPVRIIILYI